MAEFDPTSEKHYPLFIVKAVEPGCTTEWQMENLQTGEVTRISTADSVTWDNEQYIKAVTAVAKAAWNAYNLKGGS